MVLVKQTVLKPHLTQSNNIKMVLFKHNYKLIKCHHYSWDAKLGNERVFRVLI